MCLHARVVLLFSILPQNLHNLHQAGQGWLNLCKNDDAAYNAVVTYEPFLLANVWQANMHALISRVIECIGVCITCRCVADPCPSKSALNMEWLLNISHSTSDMPPPTSHKSLFMDHLVTACSMCFCVCNKSISSGRNLCCLLSGIRYTEVLQECKADQGQKQSDMICNTFYLS